MLIEWTKPCLFTINQKPPGAPITLLPGVNEIEKKEWENFGKHPLVSAHVGEGNLIIHEGTTTLKDMKLNEAKRVIEGTFDLHLLEKWSGQDKRAAVLTAIQKQMKKVNESVALKDDEKDEDE
jgi:hypothetical protein